MASQGQWKRKHNKNYYMQGAKKSRSGVLETGMKGIMITCNNNEKPCVREAYNLLNEYADVLYGPETEVQATGELENVASETNPGKSAKLLRRFQQVNTSVNNVLFIKTTVPDPAKLVNIIYEDIAKTKCRKTRFILKMTPVAATCKTSVNAYKSAMNELMEEISKTETTSATYKVICKVRHNSGITKDHIIWYGREAVENHLKIWTPTLIDPEIIVSVDVLQTVCCIGVLKKYAEYKKYNLAEMVPVSSVVPESDADSKYARQKKDPLNNETACSDVPEVKSESSSQDKVGVSEIIKQVHESEISFCDKVDVSEITKQEHVSEEDELGGINLFSSGSKAV